MNRYKEHIIKQAVTVAIDEAEANSYEDFIQGVVLLLKQHGYRFSYGDVEQVVEALEETAN